MQAMAPHDAPSANPPHSLTMSNIALKNLTDWLAVMRFNIENADLKVEAIFSISSLLVGALALSSVLGLNLAAFDAATPNAGFLLATLSVLVGGVVWSTLCVLLTIYPRWFAQKRPTGFSFQPMDDSEVGYAAADAAHVSNTQVANALLGLIYADAQIAVTKYRWANRASIGLAVALLAWLTLYVVSVIQ